jgi:low affinity Fe/Cu permease
MYNLNKFFTQISSAVHSRKGRIALMVLTIALFVLSAGAPNAMGGIGK